MRLLGHKSLQNMLVYTQMVEFKNEEYLSATAELVVCEASRGLLSLERRPLVCAPLANPFGVVFCGTVTFVCPSKQ